MGEKSKIIAIGILCYPGAQAAAVHGLSDMFLTANRLCREAGLATAPRLSVSHWGFDAGGALVTLPGSPDPAPRHLDVIILPPALDPEPIGPRQARLTAWLKKQHGAGSVIASVCVGAFLLAETGLLDGRTATTHWSLAEEMAEKFPHVTVDADKLLIEDGDIVTAGGIMAWVELGLKIIERFISPAIVLSVARFFLVDAAGREQRFYSAFSPKLAHCDERILKVQHWLQRHFLKKVAAPDMASVAGLSERTFLRRFQKATGENPTRYLQLLRLAKAREMLELTRQTIDRIAYRVGYEDPGAFTKLFHAQIGLTPSEYRKRFGVGAE